MKPGMILIVRSIYANLKCNANIEMEIIPRMKKVINRSKPVDAKRTIDKADMARTGEATHGIENAHEAEMDEKMIIMCVISSWYSSPKIKFPLASFLSHIQIAASKNISAMVR
mmetsp:Transcript_1551/g.2218  ORF Transcript_1551/g.2218 Transcript_1551/m.2218 type:complete len:113 (+) Transcript_1551:2355-2693(+)